jgi:hypothetical protein
MAPDDIDGEIDEGFAEPGYEAALARPTADELRASEAELEAAQVAAREAQAAAQEAQTRANQALEQARAAAARAERQRALAAERKEAALALAHEALRPAPVEYEIEVLDIRDESKRTKSIEFVAHGAPNFASYKGAAPILRAFVRMTTVEPWEGRDKSVFYPFEPERPRPRLGAGEGSYRTPAAPAIEKAVAIVPRTPHLEGYAKESVRKPGVLTHEIIEAACTQTLREHLDMVDFEKISRGEPEVDRSFVNVKMKVRS